MPRDWQADTSPRWAVPWSRPAAPLLLLLLLSGLGMFFMRGPGAVMAAGGPAFHAKLTLVVILSGLVGYAQVLARRVREAGGGPAAAKLPVVSNAILGLGLVIIVCAVIAFQ